MTSRCSSSSTWHRTLRGYAEDSTTLRTPLGYALAQAARRLFHIDDGHRDLSRWCSEVGGGPDENASRTDGDVQALEVERKQPTRNRVCDKLAAFRLPQHGEFE